MMIDGLQPDQQAPADPMSGALSLALQAHCHYRRSLMLGFTGLPFLGLRGLRKGTGYEIGTGQSAAVDLPWHMGGGSTMITPQAQKPEPVAKSPSHRQPPKGGAWISGHRPERQKYVSALDVAVVNGCKALGLKTNNQNPLASQAPLAANPLVIQTPGTPDTTISPMPERGAGSSSLSRPKQQDRANTEPSASRAESGILQNRRSGPRAGLAVQPSSTTRSLNPHDSLRFKDSLLQANGCASHHPCSAVPGEPNTLAPKEICRPKEKRSDNAFSSQSEIASPGPETAPRPPAAQVLLSRIYPFGDMRPGTSLGGINADPDPIAGFQPELTSKSLDQDLRLKSRAAAFPQKPVFDLTGAPPFLASKLSDDPPRDFVRSPRSNLKVVTEIIEEVVERRLTKKLAAAKSVTPIRPQSLDSVTRTASEKGLVTDPDQLARRMIRRINSINRAERFRSGYIR